MTEKAQGKNTDRELWREGAHDNDYFANSIHVTESGGIGINCGGHVIVKKLHEWHALAIAALDFGRVPYATPDRRWFDIPVEHRADRRCVTKGCDAQPVARFEASGVGSDYCAECADRIERMRIRSAETNREIDDLERTFGAIAN
jgi:hypothetical protein